MQLHSLTDLHICSIDQKTSTEIKTDYGTNNLNLFIYIYSIDQKTSKEIKTDYGPDVDWVLRGSGSLSRGSAGAVNHHSLGIDGASGQIYGSNVSLQVFFY